VAAGSAADGSPVSDLPCGEDVWVSLIIRDGNLVTVTDDMTLRAGDDVLVLAEPGEAPGLDRLFTAPRPADG
jgi:NhaP-type Na+/H+ and K+/H+ antiporter